MWLVCNKLHPPQSLGVIVTTSNKDIVLSCDVIVISVKPHQVLSVLDELRRIYKDIDENQLLVGGSPLPRNLRPLVISVATSITIKQIEEKVSLSFLSLYVLSLDRDIMEDGED